MAARETFTAAAIQLTSGTDVSRNLAMAAEQIAAAAAAGSALVVLPENFSFLGATDAERMAAAETDGDGPAQRFLVDQAAMHQVWIVGGTVPVLDGSGRACSRSLLIGPDGAVAGRYDKIHLFDVDVPDTRGERYRESATTTPGKLPVTVNTPVGRIGMAVCYDLRFPGLFHRLSVLGMDLLVLPAAFTVPTGRVHWRALLTARAVESLVYVVASAQWGEHAGGRLTYGHSMIVDPWGNVLDELDSGAGFALAEIDMMRLGELRRQFPTLAHRREL
jgi:nitrilase